MFQVTQGVAYVHKQGFFHRDLKPDNLLITSDSNVKIGDFGLVRQIRSSPPFTEYISTRWYRAPECVLRSRSYNYPVDIFALGCIMAELYLMRPIFPGRSEIDQMTKIMEVLGTPSESEWPEMMKLAERKSYQFVMHPKKDLQTLMPTAS
jgi:serine/threonine protein kinase